ncbi:maleylpyruvate isomerase N-terminal domain-containing protein [Mycobacterium sp.]|uniref:maleylpyruvate isomerase N-terminal domain-containing protein n=1 Tax=Mycobacterium sp. TaxID=1785 RepID=UPI002C20B400|nr:maleylpyruvate isomerase N-terminal domain-containing protein [Mycobacterium sp.]HME46597.1 maleylpyruvate isomerase N-terminal domain-containing protein [Mycobacterium sp.]
MTLSAQTRASFLGAVELFDSRVAAVSSDAWSSPSPCEGWTARDVVAPHRRSRRTVALSMSSRSRRRQ